MTSNDQSVIDSTCLRTESYSTLYLILAFRFIRHYGHDMTAQCYTVSMETVNAIRCSIWHVYIPYTTIQFIKSLCTLLTFIIYLLHCINLTINILPEQEINIPTDSDCRYQLLAYLSPDYFGSTKLLHPLDIQNTM